VPALGDRPAIRVAQVVPNSAAQSAGLRDNDIVLTLAGEPVTDVLSFAATIAHCRGETALKVLRNGEALTINVNLQPE
jgi:S1-C subfamily serine protease